MNNPKTNGADKTLRTPSSRPSVTGKGQGLGSPARTPSHRGVSRPGRGGASRSSPRPEQQKSESDETVDDETRAANIALLDELREHSRKAESAKDDLQRHLDLLQARYDESQSLQTRLEERLHEQEAKVEELETDKVQAARQLRDMETLYESERGALFKEKEEQAQREEALEDTVQRLKDSLAQRETRGSIEEKVMEPSKLKTCYQVGCQI